MFSAITMLSLGGLAKAALHPSDYMEGRTCKPAFQDFSNKNLAHAIHYANNHAYDKFDGTDVSQRSMPSFIPSNDGKLKLGTCTVATEAGSWHVQRVGPFQSTGGYDWWQLSWGDAFELSGLLLSNEEVGFDAYYSGVIYDATEEFVGLPPIHVHHVHVTSSVGLSWESDIYQCILHGKSCPDYSTIFEHHGDYQLPDKEGGANNTKSFGLDHHKRGTRRVYSPLSITGEFNDVRPAGSPPLRWWYQLAVRILPGPETKSLPPISMHYLYNPFNMWIGALAHLGTVGTPPNDDSFYYYTGLMPFAGSKISIELHAHQTNHQMALLFEGSPEQLGLGKGKLRMQKSFLPIATKGVVAQATATEPAEGANNRALLAHILRTAHELQQNSHLASPKLICQGTSRTDEVNGATSWNGHRYDRKPLIECVEEWTFRPGTQYTSISFHGSPDLDATKFGLTNNLFPSHTHWFVRFIGDGNMSHYTAGIGSIAVNSTEPTIAKMDVARALLFGVGASPANWLHHYILIPALNLGIFLLSMFDTQWSWFAPWPLLAAFKMVCAITFGLAALLCVWLRAWPSLTTRLGCSSASNRLACVSFVWTVLVVFSAAAFVLTAFVVPYDLHFANDVDSALLSKKRPELGVKVLMLPILILALCAPLCCVSSGREFYEGAKLCISCGDSSPFLVFSRGDSNRGTYATPAMNPAHPQQEA